MFSVKGLNSIDVLAIPLETNEFESILKSRKDLIPIESGRFLLREYGDELGAAGFKGELNGQEV